MAKGGVYRIKGDKSPLTGVKTFYNVVEWYADTPLAKRREELVTWELFVKEKNGYRSTGIKKRGINHFTFGPNAHKFSYKVEGYLHEAEGKEPMAIFVQPQKNEKAKPVEKDILGVSLTYHDGSKITKALSYRDRLKATAKCQGLEGLKIVFTLWEDDENKAGHNTKNQYITKSPEIEVDSKGYARWNFTLFSTFISLANKREDEKKQHEYYVTAEYNGKLKASRNANVNNPEHVVSAPTPKPESPKTSTDSSSPNNQVDPKGYVTKIELYDKDLKKITKRPRFGDVIQLLIEAKNVGGLNYTLRLWEHDYTGRNDLLYNKVHTFKNDKNIVNVKQSISIRLVDAFRKIGEIGNDSKNPDSGEYSTGNHQEIFAEVIFEKVSAQSSIIDVDLNTEPQKPVQNVSPGIVKDKPIPKTDSDCYCIDNQFYWGSELSCSERKKVLEVCSALWGEKDKTQKASELMSVIHLETNKTFNPAADNGAGYSGLIQFSNKSASDVNTTRAELKKMTFVKQMDYVKEYFSRKKGDLKTMTDLYLLVLKPNAVGQGANKDFILFDESVSVPNVPFNKDNLSKEPWVTKYGYSSNPSFFREKGEWANKRKFKSYSKGIIDRRGFVDGKTYMWEVTEKLVDEHYKLGKNKVFSAVCEDVAVTRPKATGKYPRWVEIAIEQESKTIRESTHCQHIIDNYHASTTNAKMKRCGSERDSTRANSAWCASFIAYCLKTSGHKFQPDPGAIWCGTEFIVKREAGAPSKTTEKWGKKHTTMYMGGIVTWHNNGHTTIIVGIDKSTPNNYILLGGNQDNGVRFWTAPKTKVHAYCIFPADYEGELLPLELIEPSDLSPNAKKSKEGSTG